MREVFLAFVFVYAASLLFMLIDTSCLKGFCLSIFFLTEFYFVYPIQYLPAFKLYNI